MLAIALLFAFVGYICAQDEVVITECLLAGGGVMRPDPPPTSCVDNNPAICVQLIKPLLGATSVDNANSAMAYKISKYCNNASIVEAMGDNCLSTCAMCCKAPQFNCLDVVGQNCAPFSGDKALCTDPLAAELAKTKCRRTCGLCAAPVGGVCPDIDTMCAQLVPILTCDDEGMKLKCMGTCNLDTCLTTTTTTVAGLCSDQATDCAAVKAVGYCTKADAVAVAVKLRCRKTCQTCT